MIMLMKFVYGIFVSKTFVNVVQVGVSMAEQNRSRRPIRRTHLFVFIKQQHYTVQSIEQVFTRGNPGKSCNLMSKQRVLRGCAMGFLDERTN